MIKNFNPQIRRLTRKILDVPPDQPLPDCSWPVREEDCDIGSGKRLIKSKSIKREIVELRSIENRDQCTVGPELRKVLRDKTSVKNIIDVLTNLEMQAGDVSPRSRQRFMQQVEKQIDMEVSRNTQLIITYVVYFIIALIILVYKYRMEMDIYSLIVNVLPLLGIFYLHILYAERVVQSTFIHLIPILLILGYGIYSLILHSGVINPIQKWGLVSTTLAVAGLSIYLLLSFRTRYLECMYLQRGTYENGVTSIMLIGAVAVIIPLAVMVSKQLSL
jgi:hypothetical protein